MCACVCKYTHTTHTHTIQKSHKNKKTSFLPHITSVSSLGTMFFLHSRQYLPLCGHALNTMPINPQIKSNSFTEDQVHDKLEVILEPFK